MRPVRDALAWAEEGPPGARLHDLFATPDAADREPALLERAARSGARVALVTDRAMAGLCDTVTPQGVAAVCTQVLTPAPDAVAGARLVAVLAGVADPGNAGTVVRTADAAGADAVVLTGAGSTDGAGPVDPHNPKCVRASMGSLFHVPVAVVPDPHALLAGLRDAGLTTVATTGRAEVELGPATDALLAGPTAWLFGSEAHGLPAAVVDAAEVRVRVPIHGRAESLNLAVAAAVCLYASARAQRG